MLERKFFHEVGNYLMMAKGMLESAQAIIQKQSGAPLSEEDTLALRHKLDRSFANMEKLEKYVLETKGRLFPNTSPPASE